MKHIKVEGIPAAMASSSHDDEIVFYKTSKQNIEEDHGDHIYKYTYIERKLYILTDVVT